MRKGRSICLSLVLIFTSLLSFSQTQSAAMESVVVPRLIRFTGVLKDASGKPLTGRVGITFSLHKDQRGGAALWIETQNVLLDASGRYSVLLGATKAGGVPMELFTSGEAQWLGLQVEGEPEVPRVLLVSVPYALKAADADTVGGKPSSAFVLASPATIASASSVASSASVPLAVGGSSSGTLGHIAFWKDAINDLGDSTIFQNSSLNVGIGNTAPAARLDVTGGAYIRGALNLPATGAATSTVGANSNALNLTASASNGTTAVNQTFRLQAEPVNNGKSTETGKLNLLFASGANTPVETGLSISNKGIISFASGQSLPTVTGNETVTGNLSANQLQSNAAIGTAPFIVNSTTQVPNLNASLLGGLPASSFATLAHNSFTSSQSITGNGLTMYIGDVACPAGTVGIQVQLFSFGCLNFAMMLDNSGNTFINRPINGAIHFREGNGNDQMTINSGGFVSIGTTPLAGWLGVSAPNADVGSGSIGIEALGGSTSSTGSVPQRGGAGVSGLGGNALTSGNTAGQGIYAAGGQGSVAGSFGGFGIEAFGGTNGDGSLARAGEFHGDVEITGCLSVSGSLSGTCQSDVRLKKNIQPFPAMLNKLVQLQPVSYYWRADEFPQYRFSSSRTSGLIAQDVEKIFPEMVSVDKGGFKRVNYSVLPYLMLQAMRELKAQNDTLQERLKAEEERYQASEVQWEERLRRVEAAVFVNKR